MDGEVGPPALDDGPAGLQAPEITCCLATTPRLLGSYNLNLGNVLREWDWGQCGLEKSGNWVFYELSMAPNAQASPPDKLPSGS